MYLGRYCRSLKTLLFKSLKFDLSPYFRNFNSVQNLMFEFSELVHPNFSQLSAFFPNLMHLYLFCTKIGDIVKFNEKHHKLKYVLFDDIFIFKPFLELHYYVEYIHINDHNKYLIERKKIIDP